MATPEVSPRLFPSPRLFALGYRATPTTLAVGAQALSRIWYPWRELLPAWSLRFLGSQPGFLGRTLWPDRVIEIYVRPGQHLDEVAFALAHEVGHAVDLEHLDPTTRARWRAGRNLPDHLEWFGASDANDFATPAGDWAECFAAWQVGPVSFQSQLGMLPNDDEQELLARLSLVAEPVGRRTAANQPVAWPQVTYQQGAYRPVDSPPSPAASSAARVPSS